MDKEVKAEEVRCKSCGRKLCHAVYQLIEIKCPRCKTLNSIQKSER